MYFYQLYHQMFVTEFHWGISIAKGTDGCMFHEKVKFDRNFWFPLLEILEHFCDRYLMRELAYPRVQLGRDRISCLNFEQFC